MDKKINLIRRNFIQVSVTLFVGLVTACSTSYAEELVTPCGIIQVDDAFTFFGAFTWNYPVSEGGPVREYFDFRCTLNGPNQAECEGVRLNLNSIDKHNKIDLLTTSQIKAGTARRSSGLTQMWTILWGDYSFEILEGGKILEAATRRHDLGKFRSSCNRTF